MPPNNFPPLYSIYIRIYGIKALGPSRRRLGTRRREGWALVVWKAGRGVGVTAVEQELINLQVLTSLYTASLSALFHI